MLWNIPGRLLSTLLSTGPAALGHLRLTDATDVLPSCLARTGNKPESIGLIDAATPLLFTCDPPVSPLVGYCNCSNKLKDVLSAATLSTNPCVGIRKVVLKYFDEGY
ncbi:hypothetical protein NDU88_003247 [Pleurodeles waltl]|uniref:Uncharacterized protein n=1 Tax=Pleurodeles waltl TaxID=8319 RepID=A0AAV7VEY2_PLEWA|nr:hypothetical protein NDU88_003247 [Pleurodeles waltl]